MCALHPCPMIPHPKAGWNMASVKLHRQTQSCHIFSWVWGKCEQQMQKGAIFILCFWERQERIRGEPRAASTKGVSLLEASKDTTLSLTLTLDCGHRRPCGSSPPRMSCLFQSRSTLKVLPALFLAVFLSIFNLSGDVIKITLGPDRK